MIRRCIARRSCAAWSSSLSPAPRAQGKRFITENDLFKFTWIADPQISPTASTVAFVRVDGQREGEPLRDVALRRAGRRGSREPPRRLTSGIRDTSPRWAPDGKRLAFVRVGREGRQGAAGADLSADDGRRRSARDHRSSPRGAGGPVWSPDGQTIAFTGRDRARTRAGRRDEQEPATDAQERRQGRSRAPSIARTAIPATSTPSTTRTSSRSPSRCRRRRRRSTSARRSRSPTASSTRADSRVVARRRDDLLHLDARAPSRTTTSATTSSTRAGRRRRDHEGREHRRQHRQPRRCRRTANGSRSSARCAASRSAPTASPTSGSPTRRPDGDAEEPDRGLRLRHRAAASAAIRRRRAAGIASRSSGRPTAATSLSSSPPSTAART